MPITQTFLAFFIGMVGLIASLIIACIGRKRLDSASKFFLLSSFVIVPIAFTLLYNMLLVYVDIWDWMSVGGRYLYLVTPEVLVFSVCLLGAFLGLRAGQVWEEQNTLSCLGCMLVPILILTTLSLVLLILP
jgi:hypothetical protein